MKEKGSQFVIQTLERLRRGKKEDEKEGYTVQKQEIYVTALYCITTWEVNLPVGLRVATCPVWLCTAAWISRVRSKLFNRGRPSELARTRTSCELWRMIPRCQQRLVGWTATAAVHIDGYRGFWTHNTAACKWVAMSAAEDCPNSMACVVWPEISEHILTFCNGKTLTAALRVCKVWNDRARRILNTRRQWVSHMSVHTTIAKCVSELTAVVDDAPFFPAAAILLTTFQSKARIQAELARVLPKSCHLVGGVTLGVIGMCDGQKAREEESEHAVTMLLAPRLSNVHFSAFSVRHGSRKIPAKITARQGEGLDEMGLPCSAVDEVRCAIMLAPSYTSLNIIDKVWESYGKNVAVCGAVTKKLASGKSPLILEGPAQSSEQQDAVYLLVAGHVHCAMTGINRVYSSLQLTPEECLSQLSSNSVSANSRETVGAIFTCCGLGSHFFGQPDHESHALAKVFPRVQVIGMFGNGEVSSAKDSVHHAGPNTGRSLSAKVPLTTDELLCTYSTVFCMLSLLPWICSCFGWGSVSSENFRECITSPGAASWSWRNFLSSAVIDGVWDCQFASL